MLARRLQGVLRQYGPEVALLTADVVLGNLYTGNSEPVHVRIERELAEELAAWERRGVSSRTLGRPWTRAVYLEHLGRIVQRFIDVQGWYTDVDWLPGDSTFGKMLTRGADEIEHGRGSLALTRFDMLVPWVALQVSRWLKAEREQMDAFGDDWWNRPVPGLEQMTRVRLGIGRLSDDMELVADWANATRPNLMSMSPEEVRRADIEWHRELENKASETPAVPGRVVHRFPDGWTFQELTTHAQLEAEGCAQGNCVGKASTYWEGVSRGRLGIYSLRDAKGRSRVTVEVDLVPEKDREDGGLHGWVRQVKGRGNNLISDPALCLKLSEAFDALYFEPVELRDWEECHQVIVKQREADRLARLGNPVRLVRRFRNPTLPPGGITGFDFFDEPETQETLSDRDLWSRTLQSLRKGDTVKVGRSLWTVERARGVTVYVIKAGTAGKKLYTLHPSDLTQGEFEVLRISGGSGNIILGEPPAARGRLIAPEGR